MSIRPRIFSAISLSIFVLWSPSSIAGSMDAHAVNEVLKSYAVTEVNIVRTTKLPSEVEILSSLPIAKPSIIGIVNDLVDRVGCCRLVRISLVVSIQFFVDASEPLIQQFFRPGIQCRERTYDSGLALSNDQVWIGDNK